MLACLLRIQLLFPSPAFRSLGIARAISAGMFLLCGLLSLFRPDIGDPLSLMGLAPVFSATVFFGAFLFLWWLPLCRCALSSVFFPVLVLLVHGSASRCGFPLLSSLMLLAASPRPGPPVCNEPYQSFPLLRAYLRQELQ